METAYKPQPGDSVIYRKTLQTRGANSHKKQSIPCTVIAIYPNGTASIQPSDPTVSRKVVKQKYLAPATT